MADDSPDPSQSESGSARFRRTLLVRGLLGVVVTGTLVLLLVRYVEWPRFVGLLGQGRADLLGLALLLYLLLYLARTWRFWLLVPRTPLRTMFAITCVHNFLLRLLPMRTGEISFAILLRRAGAGGLTRGMISLFLVRLLDGGMVVLIFASTLLVARGQFRAEQAPSLIAAGAIFVAGLLAVIYFRRLLRLLLLLLSGSLRLVRLDTRPGVARALRRLSDEIDAFSSTPRRAVLGAGAATAVQWLISFALIYLVMRAFSVKVSPSQAVLGGTASVVSAFLPIGGIGTFGTLEAGWTLGFVLVGLSTSLAAHSAFAYSMVTFVYAGVLGLFGWLALRGRR